MKDSPILSLTVQCGIIQQEHFKKTLGALRMSFYLHVSIIRSFQTSLPHCHGQATSQVTTHHLSLREVLLQQLERASTSRWPIFFTPANRSHHVSMHTHGTRYKRLVPMLMAPTSCHVGDSSDFSVLVRSRRHLCWRRDV